MKVVHSNTKDLMEQLKESLSAKKGKPHEFNKI